jgi:hypothetical protein
MSGKSANDRRLKSIQRHDALADGADGGFGANRNFQFGKQGFEVRLTVSSHKNKAAPVSARWKFNRFEPCRRPAFRLLPRSHYCFFVID